MLTLKIQLLLIAYLMLRRKNSSNVIFVSKIWYIIIFQISVASGVAARGKIPFCSTFACFLSRGYD